MKYFQIYIINSKIISANLLPAFHVNCSTSVLDENIQTMYSQFCAYVSLINHIRVKIIAIHMICEFNSWFIRFFTYPPSKWSLKLSLCEHIQFLRKELNFPNYLT